MSTSRWIVRFSLGCAAVTGIGVLGLFARALQDGQDIPLVSGLIAQPARSATDSAYQVAIPEGSRTELVAVLLTTSTCAGAKRADFPAAVRAMKVELRRRARVEGKSLHLIGVSMDSSIPEGLAFLDGIGPFHEVSAGGNWLNSLVVPFIWRDMAGDAVIPQWVLMERQVTAGPGTIVVGRERLLERVIGPDGMQEWIRQAQAPGASRARGGA